MLTDLGIAAVASSTQVVFTFDIIAPMSPGIYDFQWRMVDDVSPNQEWFGATTPNVAIDVAWPTSNLIQNPSFETGDNTGWNLSRISTE